MAKKTPGNLISKEAMFRKIMPSAAAPAQPAPAAEQAPQGQQSPAAGQQPPQWNAAMRRRPMLASPSAPTAPVPLPPGLTPPPGYPTAGAPAPQDTSPAAWDDSMWQIASDFDQAGTAPAPYPPQSSQPMPPQQWDDSMWQISSDFEQYVPPYVAQQQYRQTPYPAQPAPYPPQQTAPYPPQYQQPAAAYAAPQPVPYPSQPQTPYPPQPAAPYQQPAYQPQAPFQPQQTASYTPQPQPPAYQSTAAADTAFAEDFSGYAANSFAPQSQPTAAADAAFSEESTGFAADSFATETPSAPDVRQTASEPSLTWSPPTSPAFAPPPQTAAPAFTQPVPAPQPMPEPEPEPYNPVEEVLEREIDGVFQRLGACSCDDCKNAVRKTVLSSFSTQEQTAYADRATPVDRELVSRVSATLFKAVLRQMMQPHP